MKRFAKKLFSILISLVLLVCCFSFVACEDIKKIEVTFSVYNGETEELEDKSFTIKLYRHLAPKTVDSILNNVKNKSYYDGVAVYVISGVEKTKGDVNFADGSYKSVLMMGDLIYNEQESTFTQNPIEVDFVHGEFKANGVEGSNLECEAGSVGLWRDKRANDVYSDNFRANTGKATWFMPTNEGLSHYKDYYCVFGTFDINKESVSKDWDLISTSATSSDLQKEFVIYYTGEYSKDDSLKNNGLQFNCVPFEEYEEMNKDGVFMPDPDPDEDQSYSYYPTKISLSTYSKEGVVKPAITLKSVKIK